MIKLENIIYEYDDKGSLKNCNVSFGISNSDNDYVNGRVVLDAAELDTQTIIETVQNKLKALVQSE